MAGKKRKGKGKPEIPKEIIAGKIRAYSGKRLARLKELATTKIDNRLSRLTDDIVVAGERVIKAQNLRHAKSGGKSKLTILQNDLRLLRALIRQLDAKHRHMTVYLGLAMRFGEGKLLGIGKESPFDKEIIQEYHHQLQSDANERQNLYHNFRKLKSQLPKLILAWKAYFRRLRQEVLRDSEANAQRKILLKRIKDLRREKARVTAENNKIIGLMAAKHKGTFFYGDLRNEIRPYQLQIYEKRLELAKAELEHWAFWANQAHSKVDLSYPQSFREELSRLMHEANEKVRTIELILKTY